MSRVRVRDILRASIRWAVPVASAALLSAGSAEAATRRVECQHPLTTGQEAFNLKHVSAKTACRLVRDLARFESKPANIRKLYKCVGAGKHTPVLKLRRFEGWRLSIPDGGALRMSRGRSSFSVGGTDFPVNCT